MFSPIVLFLKKIIFVETFCAKLLLLYIASCFIKFSLNMLLQLTKSWLFVKQIKDLCDLYVIRRKTTELWTYQWVEGSLVERSKSLAGLETRTDENQIRCETRTDYAFPAAFGLSLPSLSLQPHFVIFRMFVPLNAEQLIYAGTALCSCHTWE